jgi:hypothetical protein
MPNECKHNTKSALGLNKFYISTGLVSHSTNVANDTVQLHSYLMSCNCSSEILLIFWFKVFTFINFPKSVMFLQS